MAKVTCRHLQITPPLEIPAAYEDGYVYVWVVTISFSLPLIEENIALLSGEERARSARYHHERDKKRFEVSRVALRKIVGDIIGSAPADIVFEAGPNKKPYIAGSSLYHNITHAGDKILIAVSTTEVGVDIEYIDRDFDGTDILQTCFSRPAREYIADADDPQATFYRLWTRKEALQKASGQGIDDDIVNVPCLDGTYVYNGKTDLLVTSFALGDEYTCSVATAGQRKIVLADGDAWLNRGSAG